MFYYPAKALGFLAAPPNALAFLCLAGLVLLMPARRLGRGLLILGVPALLACGLGPVGKALIAPLEKRFSAPADGPRPSGLIVLGGGVEDRLSAIHRSVELNEAGDRVVALAKLARRYPDAQLVYSGGTSALFGASKVPEADVIRLGAEALGLDLARLRFENASRDTGENARFTADLLGTEAGRDWWLVTCAFHMPRAIGAFRRAGVNVWAYPVDHRTGGLCDATRPFATVGEGLRRTDVAVKEWLGLLAYRLTGRTGTLFPRP